MILVCVGSVAGFDGLVFEIDKLLEKKKIKDKVMIQLGNTGYIPKNCEWFKFKDSLDKDIEKANLIISHAGAGIIYECLEKNKRLIVIENPNIKNKHQNQIAKKFSETKHLIWCKEIEDLENCIKEAKTFKFKKYQKPKCEIHKKIITFLENEIGK